jgi:hypothetical protein
MSRRHEDSCPGLFGPNYYSDDMAPDMQVSLGAFSNTPVGSVITLILQGLFMFVFTALTLIIPIFCLYLAF